MDLRIRELSDAYRRMVTLILSHVDPDNAPSRSTKATWRRSMRPGKLFTIAGKVVVTDAVAAGLTFCEALAQDIGVSDRTFGCILDWPKVRNTHLRNSDPDKLKEVIRIFRDSVPDAE
jgi:hypothetical protein